MADKVSQGETAALGQLKVFKQRSKLFGIFFRKLIPKQLIITDYTLQSVNQKNNLTVILTLFDKPENIRY